MLGKVGTGNDDLADPSTYLRSGTSFLTPDCKHFILSGVYGPAVEVIDHILQRNVQ